MTRPVLIGDVLSAARALMAVQKGRRSWVLARIWREAEHADIRRRETGRMHPIWGDGSVMAAALRRPTVPEPPLECAEFREALIDVLERMSLMQTPEHRPQQRRSR